MTFKLAIIALLGFIAPAISSADSMGPNGDKFYEEAAHYENSCHRNTCTAPYSHKVVYNQRTRYDKLDQRIKVILRQVAIQQATLWGDSLLNEGFYSIKRTRLDHVLAFYKNDTLIGYKIRYSEKAWDVRDCGFNGRRDSLVSCPQGRIVEGSYVSADALTYFSDEERYAEFAFGLK